MSARLTEEEVGDMQTYASTRLDGVRQQGGAEGQLESDLLALIADRATILESKRDLLAALEGLEQAWVVGHLSRDASQITIRGQHALERVRAVIANARKQDAPTGAGGKQ